MFQSLKPPARFENIDKSMLKSYIRDVISLDKLTRLLHKGHLGGPRTLVQRNEVADQS